MAVPTVMTDLSVTAASNSPAGADAVASNTGPDDYLRAVEAILRREQAQGAAVASATTTDIGATTDGSYIHITGTTTITGLGTVAAGIERTLVFDGALTLTHNATSLILPSGANITTAAGDTAIFRSEGSGNWRCISYVKASGAPLLSYQPLDDQLTTLAGITAQQATDLASVSTFVGTVLNDASGAAMFTTMGAALTSDAQGYVMTLPNGIIIQFGSVVTSAGGTATLTYSSAFPTQVYAGSLTVANSGAAVTATFDSELSSSNSSVNIRISAAAARRVYYVIWGN